MYGAFHDRFTSIFLTAFSIHYLGLSNDINNSFLGQLAERWYVKCQPKHVEDPVTTQNLSASKEIMIVTHTFPSWNAGNNSKREYLYNKEEAHFLYILSILSALLLILKFLNFPCPYSYIFA